MGDRGNIAVIQDEERTEQVWLYSHWGGHEMWEALQAGLSTFPGRRSDPSYLTRIIHEQTVHEFQSETGHGISCSITDNEYPILVVDVPKQVVFVIKQPELEGGRVPAAYKPKKVWTFDEFCALTKDPRK